MKQFKKDKLESENFSESRRNGRNSGFRERRNFTGNF